MKVRLILCICAYFILGSYEAIAQVPWRITCPDPGTLYLKDGHIYGKATVSGPDKEYRIQLKSSIPHKVLPKQFEGLDFTYNGNSPALDIDCKYTPSSSGKLYLYGCFRFFRLKDCDNPSFHCRKHDPSNCSATCYGWFQSATCN